MLRSPARFNAARTFAPACAALPEDQFAAPPEAGQLIALVDSLHLGTLNPAQCEIVRQLRSGIAALAEVKEISMHDVKVLSNTNRSL